MLERRHTFAAKLLALLVGLVAAAQIATWLIVWSASERQARTQISADLRRATLAFNNIVRDRNDLLADGGTTAARAYEAKQLFADDDPATLASFLPSISQSIHADLAIALALDGRILAADRPGEIPGGVLAKLVATASQDESVNPRATGYAYHNGRLHSLVLVPVRAPDVIAWLVLGFRIDSELARRLHDQTGMDLTFATHDGRIIATTLSPIIAKELLASPARPSSDDMLMTVPLSEEDALVVAMTLSAGEGQHARLYLQYSLTEKLRPARQTQLIIFAVSLLSLGIAIFLARRFASRLSQPIISLVGHTQRIARGDYTIRNTAYRSDELGRLSEAFDQMARGLDERDRARDLLGKSVSPEVAAQLLRDGATLGGEERQVTILFSDLRGFTTLSEKLPAPALVTLLNRYFDRMSVEIEAQGGIIDKFIGDGIMALFGAPVARDDAPDRALAAACAMERALVALNAELAAEGTAPLAIGIGVNTAQVVAGNMGYHSRLNYSVVGDGVNIAARLESLTRTAEYHTNLITSAATLAALREPQKFTARPLGSVLVKGRAEPVEIFAVS